jgi:pimeloyl-ACP methyl ester carboxylesterase
LSTDYAPVAYYVPEAPTRVLILAFGYPWPDRSASDAKIVSYARMNLAHWTQFADRGHILLIAPALGGTNFFDFRALFGRLIDPDIFVDALIDGPAKAVIPGLGGRFYLYGHSAGAQFAARYVIAHPERLECALLSAPSTYPMPSSSVPWPFGMARPDGNLRFKIGPQNWIDAAAGVPIIIIVGSKDTETRPEAPGQVGATRLARGQAWVQSMQALATSQHRISQVSFKEIEGLDHDEFAMAQGARRIFEQFYVTSSKHPI